MGIHTKISLFIQMEPTAPFSDSVKMFKSKESVYLIIKSLEIF